MAVTVSERFKGRAGSLDKRRITYIVEGTDDDAVAVSNTSSTAPATHDGLTFQGVSVTQIAADIFVTTAEYAQPEKTQRDPPSQGSVEYNFSYRATSEHIYQAIAVINDYAPSGKPSYDSKGAINIVNDGGELRVEGVQLPVPPVTNSWSYYPVNAVVTDTYQQNVEAIMGHVNSVTFKGRSAGTMRFVGCQGGVRTNDDWAITFEFSYSPNLIGLSRGDITGIAKNGHHYMWFFYEDDMDTNGRIKSPRMCHVVQVFLESSFAALGI